MAVLTLARFVFWQILCLLEVIVSAVVHMTFALAIMGSAIWIDLVSIVTATPQRSAKVVPILDEANDISGRLSMRVAESAPASRNLSGAGVFLEGQENAPIVLVHGIFGFGRGKLGTLSYWGGAEHRDNRVLVPDLGALSSIHDRACELFYYLKGGTVDYGLEHSQQLGHSRFGRTYGQGHYPVWDENHPVHFVGHSTGAQVVRVLQHMLAEKFFHGHQNTTADWVWSVTSLSGAMNGTTRVYFDGICPEDGRTMKSFSLIQLLRVGVLLYEWLDIPILKRYYAFGFDHYNLPWHKSGLSGLINTMLGRSGPFATGNWVLPDLSIQYAVHLNQKLKTYPNTYYFSYATKGTKKVLAQTVPVSFLGTHPLLFLRALQISQWRHPSHLPPPCEGYRDEDWHDNDGALNTVSMLYPCVPFEHPHREFTEFKEGETLGPGLWYYTTLEADHIYFVINRERAGVHFDGLYDSIFQRCRKQMRRLPSLQKNCLL